MFLNGLLVERHCRGIEECQATSNVRARYDIVPKWVIILYPSRSENGYSFRQENDRMMNAGTFG
jgi:hypothetical protein